MTSLVPGVDTGSIHNTGTNSLQGYGGIRMKVPGAPRLNGILLRGFGLTPDSATAFSSKAAVADRRRRGQALAAVQHDRDLGALPGLVHEHDGRAGDDRGRLRRPGGLQHRHQPERDRVDLERRRGDHHRRRLGVVLLAVRGRRLRDGQRHERDGHRHVRPHRQLPARPVHGRAPDDRRREQPPRLRQHAHDPGGRDALARALRRHRAERDAHAARRRHHARRRHAGHRRAGEGGRAGRGAAGRATSPSARACRVVNWTVRRRCGGAAAPALGPVVGDPSLGATDELALQRRGQVDHAPEGRHGVAARRPRSRSCAPTWTGSPPTTAARSACTR